MIDNNSTRYSGLPTPRQECALFLFFVFDSLSFSASLGCVVMIVALSMPRLQRKNQVEEAGRFWWLLLLTWGLLYLAVASGYVSFVLSAVAMYMRIEVLVVPLGLGGVLLVLGLAVMFRRFYEIGPGSEARWLGFYVICGCPSCFGYKRSDVKPMPDEEMGRAEAVGLLTTAIREAAADFRR